MTSNNIEIQIKFTLKVKWKQIIKKKEIKRRSE